MKTTLLLTVALLAVLSVNAQQDATPPQPPPVKPDAGCVATPAPPKAPPIRFKLPPKIQQMLDKQKAEFEKKSGITLPPPPPPAAPKQPAAKPCPPVAPVTPVAPAPATKQ